MTIQISSQPQSKFILTAGLIVLAAILGFYVLNAPDQRNGVQKFGDAIQQLPDTDKAAHELQDRTLGEKLSDTAKDEGNKLNGTTH